jgi:hypothetical protein
MTGSRYFLAIKFPAGASPEGSGAVMAAREASTVPGLIIAKFFWHPANHLF